MLETTEAAPEGEDQDDVLTPLGPAASGRAPDLIALRTFRESLAGTHDDTLDDAARIDQIRALEELKAAAAAAQARLAVSFHASQRDQQAAAGTPRRRLGRGIGEQIAAARRDAPRKGGQHLGLATALIRVLPHTMRALELGRLSEWRASLILREIACLSEADQREVDRRLAADTDAVTGWGNRRFTGEAHKHALQLDNAALAERARKAARGRRVTLRPAPDGMSYLTGLLPMTHGIAAYGALYKHASSLIARGDPRSRGQIMADTLIERLTGQACVTEPVPVDIRLVITDRTLLAGGTEPAYLPGYGSIPAGTARDLIRDAIGRQRTTADTGTDPAAGTDTDADPAAGLGRYAAERRRHADADSNARGAADRFHDPGGHPSGDTVPPGNRRPPDDKPPGDQRPTGEKPSGDQRPTDEKSPTDEKPPAGKPPDGPSSDGDRKRADKRQERVKAYAWLRAVYTHPTTGALIAMTSRRR
ncbi:uncharacterized protein DUF222, partial [Antricoccus suffuscus]